MLITICFVLALLVIFVLCFIIKRLCDTIIGMGNDFEKLDQGMTEITDAYETDCLQYEDRIEELREGYHALSVRNNEQAMTIDGLRRANDEYFQENTGIRRQLDIAQTIISEHDANCLPHIIFDKFKTPDGQLSIFQDFDVEKNQVKFTGTIDRKSLI